MNKNVIVNFLIVFVLVSWGEAGANNDKYLGIQYQVGSYKETEIPEAQLFAMGITVGHQFSHRMAIEASYLVGERSGSITFENNAVSHFIDVNLDYITSVFLQGSVVRYDRLDLYGLLGFSRASFTARNEQMNRSATYDYNTLSYGVGVRVGSWKNRAMIFEYITYTNDEIVTYSAFNFKGELSF